MGFFGDAVATTFAGEETVPPSVGLEMESGKSLEPLASGGAQVDVGGLQAGGAGYGLVVGVHVIGTGGVDGYDGCGEGVFVTGVFVLLVPHPHNTTAASPIVRNDSLR
jgi:hypothetical protein